MNKPRFSPLPTSTPTYPSTPSSAAINTISSAPAHVYPGRAGGLIAGIPTVVRVSGAGPAGRSPARHCPPSPRSAGAPGSSPLRGRIGHTSPSAQNTLIASTRHAQAVLACDREGIALENAQLDAALVQIDFGKIHSSCRTPIFDRYPLSLQGRLKCEYVRTAGLECSILFGDERSAAIDAGLPTDSWSRADGELQEKDNRLRAAHVDLVFDPIALRRAAKDHARHCSRIRSRNEAAVAYRTCSDYAHRYGVRPPAPLADKITVTGCLNRLDSPRWWCRVMRRAYSKTADAHMRSLGFVHKQASLYVSYEALTFYISQRLQNIETLSAAIARNDLGEEFRLIDLAAHGTSSPAIRRTELMVRCRGMEEIARTAGHVATLFVCTLPSRFHAYHITGARNPNFDDSTPRDGQHWLSQRWQRVRAALHRNGIEVYGLRTAEPHHDGTPHWNILVFCHPDDSATVRSAFQAHFLLSDSADEPGAARHRIREIPIDPKLGSATGYIAKYISKNIDGFRAGKDLEDTSQNRDTTETCIRAIAWASIHGIRQFQQFGAPPVSVWRELRRLHSDASGVIEDARKAADEGDWAKFTTVMRAERLPSRLWKIDLFKVWSDRPGVFGDPIGPIVLGVRTEVTTVVTRQRSWEIDWRPEDGARTQATESGSPWTCVNNCTAVTTTVPTFV